MTEDEGRSTGYIGVPPPCLVEKIATALGFTMFYGKREGKSIELSIAGTIPKLGIPVESNIDFLYAQ